MKQFVEFIPIILFFIAYQMGGSTITLGSWEYTFDGIFSATAILVIATVLVAVFNLVMYRRLEKREQLMTLAVLLFGGATLVFRDQNFLFWKPTVFNWVLALVFGGSHFIGEKNLIERTLGSQLSLPHKVWVRLNWLWVGNFALVGALNLVVAYRFSEATWVSYKLYSSIGFTLILTIATFMIITPHLKDQNTNDKLN